MAPGTRGLRYVRNLALEEELSIFDGLKLLSLQLLLLLRMLNENVAETQLDIVLPT